MPTFSNRRDALAFGTLAIAGLALSGCSSNRAADGGYRPDAAVCIREGKDAPVPAIPMGDAV